MLANRSRGRVEIAEIGPRDGLQNKTVTVRTDAKIAHIQALADVERVMTRMPALLGRAGDVPGTLSPERSPR